MAIKSVDILKGYFETGDKPRQQQFWDWLDSFFHKTDGIDIDNVAGLTDILNAKADVTAIVAILPLYPAPGTHAINIPAGKYVRDIVIIAPTSAGISVGLTDGGTELSDVIACDANGVALGVSRYFKNATTIYINNVVADTIIIIY
jgi:hypothetical protein